MDSQNTEGFRTKGSRIADNCTRLENDAQLQREKLNTAISSASGPAYDLPKTILMMQNARMDTEIPRLVSLVKALARDVDALILERDAIDVIYNRIISQRPRKMRNLSDYHSHLMSCGAGYLNLNQRAFNTVMRDYDTYLELIAPLYEQPKMPAGVL